MSVSLMDMPSTDAALFSSTVVLGMSLVSRTTSALMSPKMSMLLLKEPVALCFRRSSMSRSTLLLRVRRWRIWPHLASPPSST